ncbi:hypothetical protein HD554DRAFT_2093962 [Boletus coccyginus]|nr:hypothetical protein HD554DRAFT_2093962 [Boletus coccyginus]
MRSCTLILFLCEESSIACGPSLGGDQPSCQSETICLHPDHRLARYHDRSRNNLSVPVQPRQPNQIYCSFVSALKASVFNLGLNICCSPYSSGTCEIYIVPARVHRSDQL